MTWKRIFLALGLVLVVLIGACGWWLYHVLQSNEMEIRNDDATSLHVWAEPPDLCDDVDIAPGGVGAYRDDWLCRRPALRFVSPTLGEIVCDWDAAARRQPVVVTDRSVSCYPEMILTPIARDPFPLPSPSPLAPNP